MIPATVSPLEAIFIAALLVGIVISVALLGNAWGDLQYQKRSKKNGSRLIVAKGNLRREAERFAIYIALLGLGVFLATRAPANPQQPISPGGIALTAAILFIVVTLIGGGWLDKVERGRLIAHADAQDAIRAAAEGGEH